MAAERRCGCGTRSPASVAGEPLTGHGDAVTSLTFGHRAGRAAAARLGGARGDGAAVGPGHRRRPRRAGHRTHRHSELGGVRQPADGRLLLASGGAESRCGYGTRSPAPPSASRSPATPASVVSVAFGTRARTAAAARLRPRRPTVRLWDLASKVCILSLSRRSLVQSIALSGPLLAISDREGISVIEPRFEDRSGASEPSSCVCFADLQYVDGLGELSGAPGAAAELAEDPPGLEMGVRALVGRT